MAYGRVAAVALLVLCSSGAYGKSIHKRASWQEQLGSFVPSQLGTPNLPAQFGSFSPESAISAISGGGQTSTGGAAANPEGASSNTKASWQEQLGSFVPSQLGTPNLPAQFGSFSPESAISAISGGGQTSTGGAAANPEGASSNTKASWQEQLGSFVPSQLGTPNLPAQFGSFSPESAISAISGGGQTSTGGAAANPEGASSNTKASWQEQLGSFVPSQLGTPNLPAQFGSFSPESAISAISGGGQTSTGGAAANPEGASSNTKASWQEQLGSFVPSQLGTPNLPAQFGSFSPESAISAISGGGQTSTGGAAANPEGASSNTKASWQEQLGSFVPSQLGTPNLPAQFGSFSPESAISAISGGGQTSTGGAAANPEGASSNTKASWQEQLGSFVPSQLGTPNLPAQFGSFSPESAISAISGGGQTSGGTQTAEAGGSA